MRRTKWIISLLCCLCVSHAADAIETKATHAVVMDHATGIVLFDKKANEQMYPASMTKMMTAYMLFDALKSGKIKEDTSYVVSEEAWRKQGSKMFVRLGESIAVQDLLRGIVIQSGNDACIVFAEGYAGTEAQFSERMTEKAKEIGMINSVFKNATGWPDEAHVTTAKDLATLARRTVMDFPEYYPIYKQLDYTYNGIKQYNRNVLLTRSMGIDGLKTGHTEEAGYGITISGEDNGRRVHVVVGGLSSEKERAQEAASLYRYAMSEFRTVQPAVVGTVLASLPVMYGEQDNVDVTTAKDASILLPHTGLDAFTAELRWMQPIKAPVRAGQKLGTLHITSSTMQEQQLDVVAVSDVEDGGIFTRLVSNLATLSQ
ncbi:MAG: D-alanyl-D-alanine carboxypeptidase [Alphaproteobacteria bacterium]|nr:MAG: D-alanyl-D-alanine carboxypeptidase [Alphaproteobacteria bacterium]